MKNERILLLVLGVVQFSHIVDFMLIMPLGAQFMELFSISPVQFSLIVSAYAGTAFVSGLFAATVIDRFDRKKALLTVYLGFALGTIACSLAGSYSILLAARSLTGAFGGILSSLILSIVADIVPYERRSSAMGIIMTAFSAASVLGVPIGLFLAATYSWRFPFLVVGLLSLIMIGLTWRYFPSLTGHLEDGASTVKPFKVLANIFGNRNQLLALTFTLILMLGHFTIIPFIAPYMQLNIGFTDYQISYIYLIGGTLTVFLLPYFGKLADRYGNLRVFTLASILALGSIFAITNLPAVPIVVALCATSSFFVVASGRNVPATTMVTAVVRPEQRGGFMSVRTSINQMALALSSGLAGLIVTKDNSGALVHYPYVGYVAIFMSVLAILIARKLKAVC